MMKNIPYGKQTISEKDTKNVLKTIRSEFLTTGPTTKIFEEKFSERVDLSLQYHAQAAHQLCIFVLCQLI